MRVATAPGESWPDRKARRRTIRWAALGAFVLFAGVLISLMASVRVANNAIQQSRLVFVDASAQMAATFQTSLQHENDLITGVEAFILDHPQASEAAFVEWARADTALARYPELQGFGETVIVPRSKLSDFASTANSQQGLGSGGPGVFRLTPEGTRSLYCLPLIGLNRSSSRGLSAGYDRCSGVQGSIMLASRDSGVANFEALSVRSIPTIEIAVPVYRGGSVPVTVAARQRTFIGWVDMNLVPGVVLADILKGRPSTSLILRHRQGASAFAFSQGDPPAHAQSTTVELGSGWSVQAFAAAASGQLLNDGNALFDLGAGLAMSLLLGILIFALGNGRAHAMVLVDERTDELRFEALHDSLTRLPNRTLILDRIDQMLARSRRNHLPAAAMYLDLDDFKEVNDTLGHAAGDQLLIAIATRLTAALREGDTVGRLDGDEFILLFEGASLVVGAEVIADRIHDVLQVPFTIAASTDPILVSASMGVAVAESGTSDELLRNADVALYRAKAAGGGQAVVFALSMQDAEFDQRQLEIDLNAALEAQQFFLLYQPTLDLQTNRFVGVEALLRWRHPVRGVISPNDFIPALEANGLIVPVGAWVLEEACRQGAIWQSRGHHFSVSVNVSGEQLVLDRIVDDAKHALATSGFDPSMLVLELTETVLMVDVEETIVRLAELKALGIKLAVDDFGTGYSSLAYLRRFPIDILKIDQGFVSEIADSREAAVLVHTLVQLGKALALTTVAEGIETEAQHENLCAENVDVGQGYLFSRPLDVDALDSFVREFSANVGLPSPTSPNGAKRS
jgi:diguanylate cyclase (GGDEF)-like protein